MKYHAITCDLCNKICLFTPSISLEDQQKKLVVDLEWCHIRIASGVSLHVCNTCYKEEDEEKVFKKLETKLPNILKPLNFNALMWEQISGWRKSLPTLDEIQLEKDTEKRLTEEAEKAYKEFRKKNKGKGFQELKK